MASCIIWQEQKILLKKKTDIVKITHLPIFCNYSNVVIRSCEIQTIIKQTAYTPLFTQYKEFKSYYWVRSLNLDLQLQGFTVTLPSINIIKNVILLYCTPSIINQKFQIKLICFHQLFLTLHKSQLAAIE